MTKEKKHIEENSVWVEYEDLVFSRENPKYIYKQKDSQEIFKKLRVGSEVYFEQGGLIWCGEIIQKKPLKIYIY